MKSLSRVRPSAAPWTAAFQAPPSMGFSRQEYWSGVPLPSPPVNSWWDLISNFQKLRQQRKNLPANAWDPGDLGSIPGLGRSPGEGNGNLLQYSCLGNPMDRGAWWATICGPSTFHALFINQWGSSVLPPHLYRQQNLELIEINPKAWGLCVAEPGLKSK